jgi:hypothetical protein
MWFTPPQRINQIPIFSLSPGKSTANSIIGFKKKWKDKNGKKLGTLDAGWNSISPEAADFFDKQCSIFGNIKDMQIQGMYGMYFTFYQSSINLFPD